MMANEKRLIDANEAIEKINCLCVDGNENWIGTDNQSFVDHAEVIDILLDMPTVDAVEVVHSRAVLAEATHIVCTHKCAICDALIVFNDNYCPNCGAKMDGEV